ncbi:MAG: DUF167 domain-containing protein [Patescibacteria group bacterium]|jgi:hypothetical protein
MDKSNQKILVKVMPFAKSVRVEPILGGLKIWLTAKPVDGEANKQLIEVLADYLQVPKSAIQIKSGENGRTKLIIVTK